MTPLAPGLGQMIFIERAIHHATETHRHLVAMSEYVDGLANPHHASGSRDLRRMATLIERWQLALEKRREMQQSFIGEYLVDPDEGDEEGPELHDMHVFAFYDFQMLQDDRQQLPLFVEAE